MADEDVFACADRFWSKVNKTESCWLWTGCTNEKGYGLLGVGRISTKAHRISFFLAHGHWPNSALHSCDTPACVNPDHIRDGNAKENMADLLARGRNPNWQLDAAEVVELRRRFANGEKIASIARSVERPDNTVRAAIRGTKWAHVPGAIPVEENRRRVRRSRVAAPAPFINAKAA